MNIYFNRHLSDDDRRSEIYRGDIFVYSPSTRTSKLCALAQNMIEEAFAPHDPRHIDEFLSMEQAAAVLHKLKPAFIHHPDCKQLLPDIIAEVGGDLQKTYFDVPRMRSAYPTHYLTSGIAYAFHPHRDTWYSAPMCQINWWLPIFDILPTNCMAFHPIYFSRPAENTSEIYNYETWNRQSRVEAAKHVHTDTRPQPKLQQEIEQQDIRIICPAGGLILFSGSHLHETVPNTSGIARYSIDFRTVHADDVLAGAGAQNIDSRCTGTTIRDYRRCTDVSLLPDEIIAQYEKYDR